MARWGSQLMQEAVDRMVEVAAGKGDECEAAAANVAAAWDSLGAELDNRIVGLEIALNQIELTRAGLGALRSASTGLVAQSS